MADAGSSTLGPRRPDSPHPHRPTVRPVLARLSDDDQEVLLLTGWEGLDAGQIAEVVGCTRATVRVRLHRARRRFSKELAVEGVQRTTRARHVPGRRATARPGTEEAL